LIEQSSAILLHCVEPYGRLKSNNAHYERRIVTAIHLSSYPQEGNTTKLKIGTTTFNFLVTSSLRLGKSSSFSIQIGSNTNHFAPTQNTSIYLLEGDGFIAIINNFEVNCLLQPFADSIKDANDAKLN
jgi:hypothetical protein